MNYDLSASKRSHAKYLALCDEIDRFLAAGIEVCTVMAACEKKELALVLATRMETASTRFNKEIDRCRVALSAITDQLHKDANP